MTGPAAVETVRIAPSPDTLRALDATRQLTATALDAQGDPVSVDGFEWTSTDPAVVSVNESGTVTATGNGSAVVRASVGSARGDAEMFVFQEVSGVTITPTTAGLTELATTQQFQAEATDRNDNAVTDVDFVWISSDPSVAVVDTTGLATAEGSGQTTITAAARGVPANAVLSVTPDAAQLAFTIQPTDAEAGAAIDPGVQVEIRDSGGNLLEDARNQVTLALTGGTPEAELVGTATVGATGGVASFRGLNVEVAGSGYTLGASTPGLPDATSASFAVTPGPAAKLGFLSLPALEESAGAALGVRVAVQDDFGNTVPVTSPPVGIDLVTGPESGALVGTTQADPVDGVIDFTTVTVEEAGAYSMSAQAEALTTAVTDTFDIVPASPDSVRFVEGTTSAPVGGTISDLQVEVIDPYENVVDTFSADVSLSVASAPWPGSTLEGVLTQPAVDGVATFDGLVPKKIGQPYEVALSTPVSGVDGTNPIYVFLPTAESLAAGGSHTCLGTYGRPICWGANDVGQIGTTSVGVTGDSVAVAVDGSFVMTKVSAGSDHTCGIDNGGAASCWGSNANGKLGDGNTSGTQSQPVPVVGGITFAQVSAGTDHTCGVSTGGDAYCWGSNAQGQLGTGSLAEAMSGTPVQVTGGLSFVHVSAGGAHTCGLATDDNVYCWGDNASGQLGDGNLGVDSPSPVMVTGGGTYTYVGAGDAHSCGVVTAGPGVANVNCWGDNASGQLGDGNLGTDSGTPVTVQGSGFTVEVNTFQILERGRVDVGAEHACAIMQEVIGGYEIACWGANTTGQLGVGSTSAGSDVAVGIPGSSDYAWQNLTAGGGHNCADAIGGIAGVLTGVYCWGAGSSGQLGDGTTTSSSDPVLLVQ